MCKFNTISLDAADTLFFIKKGLGNTYNEILKKYTNKFEPKEISNCFKKYFNSRPGLYFTGLKGSELENAEKKWWYKLVKDIFDENSLIVTIEAGSVISWQKYTKVKGLNAK